MEDCSFDWPPAPVGVVCYHPDADDDFNISGLGDTKAEAYQNMLENLRDWEDIHAR